MSDIIYCGTIWVVSKVVIKFIYFYLCYLLLYHNDEIKTIVVCLGWLNLPYAIASDWQTPSGQIPWDQPQRWTDGYGGKDFEKKTVLRQEWKTPWDMSTTSPGSEPDDGEELGDDGEQGKEHEE